MATVPEVTWVATGVVLLVKVPKVPRPATAAAVPAIASEPTTLRVVARLLVMSAVLLSPFRRPRGSGDRNDSGGPTAGHPPASRKECARLRHGIRRPVDPRPT